MRKLILGASLTLSLAIVGCAAKPHTQSSASRATADAAAAPKSAPVTAGQTARALPPTLATAPTTQPNNKVITHIVSQHQTITITSSPNGLLYSLKDASGNVQLAEATPEKFAELHPQLYQQIQHYIAVHADDAPIPSATVNGPGVPLNRLDPTATREQPTYRSTLKADQFQQTSDRPFPTAREDAPE